MTFSRTTLSRLRLCLPLLQKSSRPYSFVEHDETRHTLVICLQCQPRYKVYFTTTSLFILEKQLRYVLTVMYFQKRHFCVKCRNAIYPVYCSNYLDVLLVPDRDSTAESCSNHICANHYKIQNSASKIMK